MKFKAGDKVRFTDAQMHETNPEFFPKFGTTGVIQENPFDSQNLLILVKWEDGSTSKDDAWCVSEDMIEAVEREEKE